MTIAVMLEQSGVLSLLGMGIVFSFLVILIISVTISGKIIHALGMDKDLLTKANQAPAAAAEQAAVTAAIGAAVTEYRKRH